MAEFIKGISIVICLCTITTLGGRKNDSRLIALAGISFVLINILSGLDTTTQAIESSWLGYSWDSICNFVGWIFGK